MSETIWFTAPAWLSNTLVAIFYYFVLVRWKWLPRRPLDGNKEIGGKRILGDNKTLFGSIGMVLFAAAIGAAQGRAMFGFGMGIATLAGGLANSFLKRRLGMREGSNLPVLDQVDYALVVVAYLEMFPPAPDLYNAWAFLGFALFYQLAINYAAFRIGFIPKFLWMVKERSTVASVSGPGR